jgi:hypothetical protein
MEGCYVKSGFLLLGATLGLWFSLACPVSARVTLDSNLQAAFIR